MIIFSSQLTEVLRNQFTKTFLLTHKKCQYIINGIIDVVQSSTDYVFESMKNIDTTTREPFHCDCCSAINDRAFQNLLVCPPQDFS